MKISKQQLFDALQTPGFENRRPRVDVPHLNRPLSRPDKLPGPGRIAAVMLLAYEATDHDSSVPETRVVLTKRHAKLSKHANQISFPGGRQDNDETLAQTAIRETNEEIGIATGEIEILGKLNPVYIPPSDFTVTPFVGWHSGKPAFVRSESEVDMIIEVSLEHLLDPSTLVFGDIAHSSGEVLNVPFYLVDGHKVWGATAIMIGEFLERIRVFTNSPRR